MHPLAQGEGYRKTVEVSIDTRARRDLEAKGHKSPALDHLAQSKGGPGGLRTKTTSHRLKGAKATGRPEVQAGRTKPIRVYHAPEATLREVQRP